MRTCLLVTIFTCFVPRLIHPEMLKNYYYYFHSTVFDSYLESDTGLLTEKAPTPSPMGSAWEHVEASYSRRKSPWTAGRDAHPPDPAHAGGVPDVPSQEACALAYAARALQRAGRGIDDGVGPCLTPTGTNSFGAPHGRGQHPSQPTIK